ncbi:MAG: Crp/Fnr family transcriptional regulator [Xanthomonadales bacterium]
MNFLRTFDNWANTETHKDGSVIFSDSEPADALFLVLEGEIVLTLRGHALSNEGRGALIGEMAIIDDTARNATAVASGTVRLARISPDEFRDLITEDPEFSLHAMAELARRLRAVDALLGSRIE